jgi:hypothetical protein
MREIGQSRAKPQLERWNDSTLTDGHLAGARVDVGLVFGLGLANGAVHQEPRVSIDGVHHFGDVTPVGLLHVTLVRTCVNKWVAA